MSATGQRSTTTAVYVISVAAELVGMHPQTLRNYERTGLLDPSRTRGGERRFSDGDLDQLRRIQQLTGEGHNLEGVRRILELEARGRRAAQASSTQLRAARGAPGRRGAPLVPARPRAAAPGASVWRSTTRGRQATMTLDPARWTTQHPRGVRRRAAAGDRGADTPR